MKEQDIRPQDLFHRYLELSLKDAQELVPETFSKILCPGCGADTAENRFKKNGFQYVICRSCGSLYCSPRPNEKDLTAFYVNSKSAQYWSEVFFPAVAEKRRTKLFRKKAENISGFFKKKNYYPKIICDVGAGYGIFLEEMKYYFPDSAFFAIEPGSDLAKQCRAKGFTTLQKTAEQSKEWDEKFDFVISSEVIEHVYSCENFIKSLYSLVKPGGFCLVTGLGYEGFDILTLQQDSNSISPPHHINFLSINGFRKLFSRSGFSNIEIWTPGELDVDIIRNSSANNAFVNILASRGEQALSEFQSLLQKYQLSSHVWIMAQKL